MNQLEVVTFRHGPFWNFSYLLASPDNGVAAVVDPAWDVPRIIDAAAVRRLKVTTALITHGHSDHVNGLAELIGATGARVIGHVDALAMLSVGDSEHVALHGGETLAFGDHSIEVLHTPGHSQGSLSFLTEGRLFCGDTLNVGSVGRPGPDRQSVDDLWRSLRRIRELPDETIIYPGHDDGPRPWSTVADELANVPAWRLDTFEEFVTELERTTGRSHRHEEDS